MLSHDCWPLHAIVHDAAFVQSTLRQLLPEHVMVQLNPLGHVTLSPPTLVIAHVLAAVSHDEHWLGHDPEPEPPPTTQ